MSWEKDTSVTSTWHLVQVDWDKISTKISTHSNDNQANQDKRQDKMPTDINTRQDTRHANQDQLKTSTQDKKQDKTTKTQRWPQQDTSKHKTAQLNNKARVANTFGSCNEG